MCILFSQSRHLQNNQLGGTLFVLEQSTIPEFRLRRWKSASTTNFSEFWRKYAVKRKAVGILGMQRLWKGEGRRCLHFEVRMRKRLLWQQQKRRTIGVHYKTLVILWLSNQKRMCPSATQRRFMLMTKAAAEKNKKSSSKLVN
ncbi:hypothetical protein PIB30_118754 [Stylosanthes scabra]|uniref:Uncharacterized protein n=1 Tax=Stylosanthes scabra TaxID=79078 RepID=A0ABU6Q8L0_9FABA|nr:hypothetical protein [Stylosanthes scabra]